MPDNCVSANLSHAVQRPRLEAVSTILAELSFLADLSSDGCRALPKISSDDRCLHA